MKIDEFGKIIDGDVPGAPKRTAAKMQKRWDDSDGILITHGQRLTYSDNDEAGVLLFVDRTEAYLAKVWEDAEMDGRPYVIINHDIQYLDNLEEEQDLSVAMWLALRIELERQKLTPGCYFDSNRGTYNIANVVVMAIEHGYTSELNKDALVGKNINDLEQEEAEALMFEVEEAEAFLSTLCPEGYYFGCTENGDYGVWPEEEE